MPGYRGKAKAPHEMTTRDFIATQIACTVICGVIASGVAVTVVHNYSVVITLLICGAALTFLAYFYVTVSWHLVGELVRRRDDHQ